MKLQQVLLSLFILTILATTAANAQTEFTHTVTAKNKYCNAACSIMDIADLNDNPRAVILVTPLEENGRNPHPVGVYYAAPKKWSIINTDGTAIAEGLKFKVEYYSRPDVNQFAYVIPGGGATPCVDHAALNSNPNAQIRVTATQSPRGAYFNPDEVKIAYDASALKWCLANVNNSPIRPDTAYNIVISSRMIAGSNSAMPTTAPYVPVVGISILPAPVAPVTVVVRTEWTIPFQSGIALSPGYCSVIKDGYSNPAILMTDTVIVTGHQYGQGANLRWTAEAGNGSLVITVCNNGNSLHSSSAHTYLNDKKINILVLR